MYVYFQLFCAWESVLCMGMLYMFMNEQLKWVGKFDYRLIIVLFSFVKRFSLRCPQLDFGSYIHGNTTSIMIKYVKSLVYILLALIYSNKSIVIAPSKIYVI